MALVVLYPCVDELFVVQTRGWYRPAPGAWAAPMPGERVAQRRASLHCPISAIIREKGRKRKMCHQFRSDCNEFYDDWSRGDI